MAMDVPPHRENPETTGVEPGYFFGGTVIVPNTGTTAPPRPPEMERRPLPSGMVREWEYVEFEGTAVLPPPGTMAPPRPPGKARVPATPTSQPEQIQLLVSRIEAALQTIHAALAEIKQLQNKAG